MKNKRILLALFILIISMGLTACGSSTQSPEGTPPVPEDTAWKTTWHHTMIVSPEDLNLWEMSYDLRIAAAAIFAVVAIFYLLKGWSGFSSVHHIVGEIAKILMACLLVVFFVAIVDVIGTLHTKRIPDSYQYPNVEANMCWNMQTEESFFPSRMLKTASNFQRYTVPSISRNWEWVLLILLLAILLYTLLTRDFSYLVIWLLALVGWLYFPTMHNLHIAELSKEVATACANQSTVAGDYANAALGLVSWGWIDMFVCYVLPLLAFGGNFAKQMGWVGGHDRAHHGDRQHVASDKKSFSNKDPKSSERAATKDKENVAPPTTNSSLPKASQPDFVLFTNKSDPGDRSWRGDATATASATSGEALKGEVIERGQSVNVTVESDPNLFVEVSPSVGSENVNPVAFTDTFMDYAMRTGAGHGDDPDNWTGKKKRKFA